IARIYNVAVSDLMVWNELKGNDLSVGQSLIIEGVVTEATASVPADSPKVAAAEKSPKKKPETTPVKQTVDPKPNTSGQPTTTLTSGGWITHKVSQGQTLFSIARQYDAKVEDLIAWN